VRTRLHLDLLGTTQAPERCALSQNCTATATMACGDTTGHRLPESRGTEVTNISRQNRFAVLAAGSCLELNNQFRRHAPTVLYLKAL